MMGYLNSFSASGGGNLNKNFAKNTNARGLPGGGMLSFDLTGTLRALWLVSRSLFRFALEAMVFINVFSLLEPTGADLDHFFVESFFLVWFTAK